MSRIASANKGNRAAGHPGYAASVAFVQGRAQSLSSALEVWFHPFNKTTYTVNDIQLTGPDGEEVYVVSPTANIGGVLTGELVDTPVTDQGCKLLDSLSFSFLLSFGCPQGERAPAG